MKKNEKSQTPEPKNAMKFQTSENAYSSFFQSLDHSENKRKHVIIEISNIQKIPYEVPAMFSLEFENEILQKMKNRLDFISQNMGRTDVESISLDWKRIGGDINNAISRNKRSIGKSCSSYSCSWYL